MINRRVNTTQKKTSQEQNVCIKSRKQKKINQFSSEIKTTIFKQFELQRKKSWSHFLNNAVEKEIFSAYKFTKNNQMKKLSSIQYDEKTNIEFEDKYNAFIEAMYLVSLNIENTNEKNEFRLKLNSESFEWSNLIESELRKAIFTFASNKASRSN